MLAFISIIQMLLYKYIVNNYESREKKRYEICLL